MKSWSHYWNWFWEPMHKSEQATEVSEPDPVPEQLPPNAARQAMRRQQEDNHDVSWRQRAAHVLQGALGNRELAKRSAGRPLPASTRARLEASLGVDLSSISLHRDEAAAGALNARAFTVNNHIVLQEESQANDLELLGHEAAHVVQARKRGVSEGLSKPGGATESEARAAGLRIPTRQQAQIDQTGGPVPVVQRQEQVSGIPPPADPLVRRESVRLMLILHYQQQGGTGLFKLTSTLTSELKRLIPELSSSDIVRLWTPEPADPLEAFQRLVNAGYLPWFKATSKPGP